MKIWLKRISVLLLIILGIWFVWDVATQPKKEECSICEHPKAHAPCILNLSTGEITELELFQPHFTKTGEISDQQTGGTFSFIQAAGLTGIKLTDPWYIEVDVPMEGTQKSINLFCVKCCKLLNEYEKGFVLLDIYDVEHPVVYDLSDGAIYTIRCYQIAVSAKMENNEWLVRVDGRLHDLQEESAE